MECFLNSEAKFRSMRKPSNVLLLNLSVTDLILSLSTLPVLGVASLRQAWVFGESGCLLYGFIGSVTSIVSITTLTMIAIERSIVITFSRKVTLKQLIMAIQFTWIYGIFWATMPLAGWGRYIIEGSRISCTFDFLSRDTLYKSFVISLQTCVFYVPVSLIMFSYASIFVKVSRNEREMDRLKNTQQLWRSSRFNIEIKVAKTALVITMVFCLSWLPYAVVALIGSFGNIQLITPLTSAIPGFCAKLSTSINPLIYVLLNGKYRSKLGKDFRSMLRCVCPST
ncbi:rhodopsin-like [Mizuhopecten yessoensis]|uniref:rhodopsin-like n=1 Tax=Mizuhopecten yessoensis TaxID=6573 RepID=UPI000B457632|nr:rhodopsin-like [Mizuhopecten yessoensis]